MNGTPVAIDRKIARQAAAWFLRLQSPTATRQDQQDCAEWRRLHADHERAWQLATRLSDQLHSIPAPVGRATLYRSSALQRRSALKALTSMLVIGSLGFVASRSPTVISLTADASSGVGERRQLTLADGTEVHLDTDSAIDIRYTATARLLVLRKGEIFVSTGKDPRPFSVESMRGSYQPLGTRFAVRQGSDHDLLRVVQGQVIAVPHQAPLGGLQLQAGQQATIGDTAVQLLPQGVQGIDWVEGVLRVERMRLADFVAELGRYRQGWTRCEPEVAELLISGAFQLQDTDNALAAVALTLPVTVRHVTRYWVTLGPAKTV